MVETFKIKIGEFEGPLGLLLSLIEKRKMHISQVSLAQVADDYVNYLKSQESQPMEAIANFIMVASTLMLIKSFALLPELQLTEEEKESVTDLEYRLEHLLKIRNLNRHLKERFGRKVIWGREEGSAPVIVFSPTKEITPARVFEAIKRLINNLPVKEIIPQTIIKKVISLEEVIGDLAERIERAIRLSFSDFVKGKEDKVNIIVSFLGMLELVKQGVINIEQKAHLAEIEMENKLVGIPRY